MFTFLSDHQSKKIKSQNYKNNHKNVKKISYSKIYYSSIFQKVTSNKPTTLPLTGTDTDKFKPKKTAFLFGPKDEGNDSGNN